MVAALLASGCKESNEGKGSRSGDRAVLLTKYGLKGHLAGEAKDPVVKDTSEGEQSVTGENFTLIFALARATDSKTPKEAQEAAAFYQPKNIKSSNVAGGWALTYEQDDPGGLTYVGKVRRTIADKEYFCDVLIVKTLEARERAVDFCISLTK